MTNRFSLCIDSLLNGTLIVGTHEEKIEAADALAAEVTKLSNEVDVYLLTGSHHVTAAENAKTVAEVQLHIVISDSCMKLAKIKLDRAEKCTEVAEKILHS